MALMLLLRPLVGIESLPNRHMSSLTARHQLSQIGRGTGDRMQVVAPLNSSSQVVEVSVVIPCLNEADTIGICVQKALASLAGEHIRGEVVVADNGSTDGSDFIAAGLGARVIHVSARGYGSALMAGIRAASGVYIIMGDADDSYDFGEIPRFVKRLREGYELVQGCRLPAGGGQIESGAMPWSHRWGNPLLSFLAKCMFRVPATDIYCGFRGFTKELCTRLEQRCSGMEFATEMIIKATLHRARISEIPITLHRDGRKSHPPHLRTYRDGWRTLRFFLLCSPKWLFFVPGLALLTLGFFGGAAGLGNLHFRGVIFDAHTTLFGSLALLCGHQCILFAIFAKMFAIQEKILPEDKAFQNLVNSVTLERGLIAGVVSVLAGFAFLAVAVSAWQNRGFGPMDYSHTMKIVIPGFSLVVLGFQTVLSSFFGSILNFRRSQD
jgi:glycosyltransferase involved in cell wall biosynthesis